MASTLAERGVNVTVMTRDPAHPFVGALASTRIVAGDAADSAALRAGLSDARAVVYCAGSALPAEAEAEPAVELQQSAVPLVAVLDAVRERSGVPVLYLSSGGTIYGEPEYLPVDETHPIRPSTAYAAAKAAAEQYLLLYREQHGVATTAVRCSNVYGPGQRPFRSQGVVATLLASARADRQVVLFGDGSACRDYVLVDDVAAAIGLLLERGDLPAAVNVGTGVGTQLDQLVDLVEHVTRCRLQVTYEPERPTDLRRVVLDIGLLRRLIPFEPRSLAEGLRLTWDSAGAVTALAQ